MIDNLAAQDLVSLCLQSYPRRDRLALEAAIAPDFHFTTPKEDRLDRRAYFERWWPRCEDMAAIDLKRVKLDDNRAFVTYEVYLKDGRRQQHAEVWTLRQGQVKDVEVLPPHLPRR